MTKNGVEEEKSKVQKYDDRQYQIDLYKAAVNRNIIVCLGTGTGKTYISILLMARFKSQLNGSYRFGEAKRTFFLVPTRPLVYQQSSAIRHAEETSSLKVKAYTGDMDVDDWGSDKWYQEFEETQILVMTHQILLNLLTDGIISFDRINLLVIDEVHWAAKKKMKKESNHPYKKIMNLYNMFDPSRRPKVLGLSATPINCSLSVESFDAAVEDIEQTYSAVCMTGDTGTYGTNPEESLDIFLCKESTLSPTESQVLVSLESFLEALKELSDQQKETGKRSVSIIKRMKKILTNVRNILAEPQEGTNLIIDKELGEDFIISMTWMGVWCVANCIDFYITELKELTLQYEEFSPYESYIWRCGHNYMKTIRQKLDPELKSNPRIAATSASPKMNYLLNIVKGCNSLLQSKGSSLCGIIFVNQRCVAKAMADWLTEIKRLEPQSYGFLEVGWVVGHSSSSGVAGRYATNTDSQQLKTIEDFRNQKYNLLVATSVLEEGLDVRKCNLVIRYDKLHTFRQYLQSKGRARAEHAFYCLMTSDKSDDLSCIQRQRRSFWQMEEKIKDINNKQRTGQSSVRVDVNTSSTNVTLNLNANQKDRKSTKDWAIDLGLRRDTINTFSKSMGNPLVTVPKQVANVFIPTETHKDYYLCGFSMDFPEKNCFIKNSIQFGSITRKPLNNSCVVPVYLKTIKDIVDNKETSEIKTRFFQIRKIVLTDEQKKSIEKFHRFTFEEVLHFSTNKIAFNSVDPYLDLLVVPLDENFEINWDFIEQTLTFTPTSKLSVEERKAYIFDGQLFKDCIFYSPYKELDAMGRPFMYYAINVTDMTSNSQWIDDNKQTSYKTLADYFSEHYSIEIQNKSFPLIEGRRVNKSDKGLFKGAQLKPYSTGKKEKRRPEYYPPELICVHPFPASLWRQALCLPTLIYRVNHLFLAEELRQTIHSETNPAIGELNQPNNELKIVFKNKTSEPIDAKRKNTGEHEEKQQKKQNYFLKMSETVGQTNWNAIPMAIENSLDILQNLLQRRLSEETAYYIRQFSDNFNAYVLTKNDIKWKRDHIFKVLDNIKKTKIKKNFADLTYGDALPFIFEGDISPYIDNSLDWKLTDPVIGPTTDVILEAMTLKGAEDGFNLERLEVIGDSFLKLVTSMFVYFSCKDQDEGRLTVLRMIQICNRNLYLIGCEKQIHKRLVSHKLFPNTNWLPPSYHISDENDLKLLEPLQKENKPTVSAKKDSKVKPYSAFKHRIIKEKCVADAIEALIGAHLDSGRIKTGLIFMKWLGLKVDPINASTPGSFDSSTYHWPTHPNLMYGLFDNSCEIIRRYNETGLPEFETKIGYVFKNKRLLVQAFTPNRSEKTIQRYGSTVPKLADCHSYETLEFLGDSIIDYLITQQIYNIPNKEYSPGELTDLRSALVNNAFFAAICVKYEFHKYFLVFANLELFQQIITYVKNFYDSGTDAVLDSINKLTQEETSEPEECEVPKVLGDIFESVAGAIYLDNGYSLDGVWKVYYKLMKPEIDYFSEHIPIMPVRQIHTLFPEAVKFGKGERFGLKTRVVLTVNGKEYVGIGKNKKFAKIAAAKSALKKIRRQS